MIFYKQYRDLILLALGPITFLIIYSLPTPEGLTPFGMKSLGAALWVVIWWCVQVFSLAEVGFLSIFIFSITGVLSPIAAFNALGSHSVMMMLGALLILGVMKESNLITRYAYWVMMRKCIRKNPFILMIIFAFSVSLVSAVVPNVLVAIIFVSIALEIAEGINAKPGNGLIKSLCVMSGVGSALGGAGTPIGGAPNLVVIAGIFTAMQYEVSFLQWTAIGLPLALIWTLIMCILAWIFFCKDLDINLENSAIIIEEKYKKLGKMTLHEHIAAWAIILALFLWILGEPIARAFDLNAIIKLKILKPGAISLLIALTLLLIPIKKK